MMTFSVPSGLRHAIEERYWAHMGHFPQKRQEVERFLQGKDGAFCLCLRYLYGHLPVQDVVSFPVELLAGYAESTLAAYEAIEYMKSLPWELFFPYVLWHRVNTECLDDSRGALLAQLLPLVQGKDMEQAALAVNYWCCSRATYTPADDRTLGPLAIMRRTQGRCGEESVLAVAALRSVGIPARQCYCPRWSHCDDNHAWVEVWVDGDWHYLGACEPEPVLDKGWFTAAASRAMLVHSKCWSDFDVGETALQTTPLYTEVSCTARYADLRTLTVRVTQHGAPLQGVAVAFQIVNYSELFTLHRGYTDRDGLVRFATGLGDLCVYVFHNGKMLLQKLDMRVHEGVLELELDRGYALDTLPPRMEMDLVPPAGKSDVAPRFRDGTHEEKLAQCHHQRADYAATFPQTEHLREAAGNWRQLQAFWEDDRYTEQEKKALLRTLRVKDLVDVTCQTLLDALDGAQAAKGRYPDDVFQDYILAPRIANEMLQPERGKIRALFPAGFANPGQILGWMQKNMQTMEEGGVEDYDPSPYGCLVYRQVPGFAYDLVFVALCRAFGFPARLAPDTRKGQWLDAAGKWQSIDSRECRETVALTLENSTGKKLHYDEHFTLAQWDGRAFRTLRHGRLVLEKSCTLQVQPGLYRLITTTRQIDGTASVVLRHLQIRGNQIVELELPRDQTRQRLVQMKLELPAGPVRQVLEETAGGRRILIFAEPGGEPTEHLLQELLECAGGFHGEDCQIRIFVETPAALENATLRRVDGALRMVKISVCHDPEGEAALHRLMHQGDLRLPFVIAVDAHGRGVYASANYNIGMAQTLLRIQKLLTEQAD